MAEAGASDEPVPPPSGGWIDKFTQRLTVMGVIATAIVGLGGQLNSCTAQKVERYSSFRTSVTSEENYWKDLLQQNVDLASEANAMVNERKAFMLISLGGHTVPSFAEFKPSLFDGAAEIKMARDRLNQMKVDLGRVMASSDNPRVAAAARAAFNFDDGQAQLVDKIEDGPVKEPPPAPSDLGKRTLVRSDDIPNPSTQVMVAGNPGGWDVDVFWCAGGSEDVQKQNYATARAAAKVLAQQSVTGKLTASVFLGKIRLRPLPLLRQGGAYPSAGSNSILRAEATDAEQEAATAILKLLNGNKLPFTLSESQTPTRWYLSMYVCLADTVTPATAPQPPSGNRATAS